MATKTFQPGDRVKYASTFLRSIQGHELARDRGTVTEVIPGRPSPSGKTSHARIRIRWDGDDEIRSSIAPNIAHAGRPD